MTSLPKLEEILAATCISLLEVNSWRGIRVLAWDGNVLYASRGYEIIRLLSADLQRARNEDWETVARFDPAWWRNITSRSTLTYRLVRDGFHALVVLGEEPGVATASRTHDPAGDRSKIDRRTIDPTLIAAVPGAIVTRTSASRTFLTTHKICRGTRPLHITAVPGGNIYWGEYFDNRERAEVHIYGSADRGQTWQIAYAFPAGAIRHVHNIIYDRWANCLWILTGDEGSECKILRADRDLRNLDTVLSGNQQARAVAAIPTEDALYLATDTPSEPNHVLRVDRAGNVTQVADLASSSIFGCQTANALFFTTMAEPSDVNTTRLVHLVGSADRTTWQTLAGWQKDALPMRYFQYGNVILPDGENTTNYLATTAIAVKEYDFVTTLSYIQPTPNRVKTNDLKTNSSERTPSPPSA